MRAVTFRIRGGLLEAWHIPGQVSRLTFCVAAALTAWVAGLAGLPALLTIPAWFLGCVIALGGWISLGRNDKTEARDFLIGAGRGVVRTLPAALVLWWFADQDWWLLALAGLGIVADYWAGRQSGLKLWGLGDKDFTQVGEALTGVTFGLGTIAALTL